MLRFHRFTIGHAWITDYGCADRSKAELEYLLSYRCDAAMQWCCVVSHAHGTASFGSPLHNVRAPRTAEEELPAILVETADHDDRVSPLHTYKMVAALQEVAGRSPFQQRPLIARIDRDAGHGAGKPTSMVIAEAADTYAFIATQLGLRL